MTRQRKAYLFALSAVLLWSTVASAFKISLRYLSPDQLVFFSTIFSVLVLFFVLSVQGKVSMLLTTSRNDWLWGCLLGTINPFLYYLVLFKAYDLLPAQQAQPLNYTWAITLSLLSVPILGHRLKPVDVLAVVTSYFGVYVISTQGDIFSFAPDNPVGVALALGSTILWAIYWLMNTRDTRDPVLGLFLNFVCSFFFISAYLLMTEGLNLPPWQGLAGAAYIGFFEMGIAFVLWLMALKTTESTAKIANLIFLSPFLSLLLIHWVVGEDIHPSSFIGLFLIVVGLFFQNKK